MVVMAIPVTGQIWHANSEISKTWLLESLNFTVGSQMMKNMYSTLRYGDRTIE